MASMLAFVAAFIVFSLLAGMAKGCGIFDTIGGHDAFMRRFPPISDDDFMARCTPGTSRAVALKVRRIVAHQLGIEYERIYLSSWFVEDLGAD